MQLLNTSDEPVKVGGVEIAPGQVADVTPTPSEWVRLCVRGPLAVVPDGLLDEQGGLQHPPPDVLARYGLDLPDR